MDLEQLCPKRALTAASSDTYIVHQLSIPTIKFDKYTYYQNRPGFAIIMTTQEATYFLLNKLRTIYPDSESSQITDWVMEHLTGSNKAERMIYKNSQITTKEEAQLKEYCIRLLKHEPVQYILKEAWFCGLKFYVDNNVLIPRPETEELVELVRGRQPGAGSSDTPLQILDIGTGSGCIAISLKKKLANTTVIACDVSEKAIAVVKKNAELHKADIHLKLLNFLDEQHRDSLPSFDIVVSNPPYVPEKDKDEMQPNVLDFEPHTALFVPDDDPLIFYKSIFDFAEKHLNKNGSIYLELHEKLAESVARLFEEKFNVELKNDLQGKQRMLRAKARG